jgi:hypothetical protein
LITDHFLVASRSALGAEFEFLRRYLILKKYPSGHLDSPKKKHLVRRTWDALGVLPGS